MNRLHAAYKLKTGEKQMSYKDIVAADQFADACDVLTFQDKNGTETFFNSSEDYSLSSRNMYYLRRKISLALCLKQEFSVWNVFGRLTIKYNQSNYCKTVVYYGDEIYLTQHWFESMDLAEVESFLMACIKRMASQQTPNFGVAIVGDYHSRVEGVNVDYYSAFGFPSLCSRINLLWGSHPLRIELETCISSIGYIRVSSDRAELVHYRFWDGPTEEIVKEWVTNDSTVSIKDMVKVWIAEHLYS